MTDDIILFQNSNGEFEELKDEYTIHCKTEKDFNYIKTLVKIGNVINDYAEKHELAMECGGEYIMQNDEAQVDGLDLVCEIFDILSDESEGGAEMDGMNLSELPTD